MWQSNIPFLTGLSISEEKPLESPPSNHARDWEKVRSNARQDPIDFVKGSSVTYR